MNGANDYFIFGETRYLYRDDQLLSFPYTYGRESNVFFVNEGDGLQDASEGSGADFTGTSRSTAYLDYDNDGDLDVAVNNFHQTVTFQTVRTRLHRMIRRATSAFMTSAITIRVSSGWLTSAPRKMTNTRTSRPSRK